jgi:vacuolar-type H+-ATPase subunit H
MKNLIKICFALALTLPFAACSENNAANAVKDATAKAAEGVDKMKAEFAKLSEGQLGEVTKSITELQSKAASATGEKKTEVDGMLKNIMAKKDELMKMMGDVKGMAAGAGFDGMKDKLTNGIADLKKMVEAAMAKLK